MVNVVILLKILILKGSVELLYLDTQAPLSQGISFGKVVINFILQVTSSEVIFTDKD